MGADPPIVLPLHRQVFNSARRLLFLVLGSDKAQAVAATLEEPADLSRWPAQRIRPQDGTVTWYLDRPAAAILKRDAI